jgi:nucleoside-diphosphate-sugar epimerase
LDARVVRVLVTGATGFVASHLLPALAATGHDVLALGHDAQRIPSHDRVAPVVVDLRDLDASALPEVDAIVHLAQANVPFPQGARDLAAVNAGSTAALLDHARRVGVRRFVLASSASVYGGGLELEEDDPLRATDFYAATKIAAERFVAAYAGLLEGTTTMRLVTPYGPGQMGRLIPRLAQRIRAGDVVVLNEGGTPRLNPIFVADVVRVVISALEQPGHRRVNVAGDEIVGMRELAQLVGEALGVEPSFEESGVTALDVVARNERMKRELGVDGLISLSEGLRRTLAVEAVA